MGILSNISGKVALKAFTKAGYHLERQEGSHMILYCSQPAKPPLSIPNHKELAPGLIRSQIKRAGLTVDEFRRILKAKN